MLIEASTKHKSGQKLFRVLADKLSGSFQFFQIEAFLLQPLADWLASDPPSLQNHGLTLSKAGTGEKANRPQPLGVRPCTDKRYGRTDADSLEFLRL